jgi:hypothetical protein
MNKLLLLSFISSILSCSTANKSSTLIKDDEIFFTRKYIGNFLDYSHTGPQIIGGRDLIWIKTTIYNAYGHISAYSKRCDFSVGDRIYLKPIGSSPGNYGYWEYQIENDSSIYYKVSEYRFENNAFVKIRSF